MNILIISAVFPPEPVVSAKLSFDIANELSINNAVTVISPKPSRPFGFKFTGNNLSFNFNHIQVNSYFCASSNIVGRFRESYSFGKHCYKYITANHKNIDIIYANIWALFGQYYVVKAAKKYNIPIFIHVQDIYPESINRKMSFLGPFIDLFWLPVDKYVLHNVTKVIAISDKMKSYLVSTRKLESQRLVVVQNWQDETAFINYKAENKQPINKKELFTFMYLGNIGPVAGVEILIDAFAQADLKNCRLIIAGSGSMKATLQKKVNEMNLHTIEFWPVPEGKVPEIQAQANVMLLPVKKGAAKSSIPSKLPAYMFSEKPVIACVDEDCDTANAIISSDCGWVLPPENIFRLSEMMQSVVSLPSHALNEKGESGFKYALENFSKKNNLPKLTSLIINS